MRQEQKVAELTCRDKFTGQLDLTAALARSTQSQEAVNVTARNSLERFAALLQGLAQNQLLEDRVDSQKPGNGNRKPSGIGLPEPFESTQTLSLQVLGGL